MSNPIKWEFDSAVYLTEDDLEAARRDKAKIEAILSKYPDIEDSGSIYEELQNSGYKFESKTGMSFDDFIYENRLLYPPRRNEKKKPELKLKEFHLKEFFSKRKRDTQVTFFHEFDSSLQNEIINVMKKKERYRIAIAALCFCICLTSFGYFGIYLRAQDLALEQYEELALIKANSKKTKNPVQREVKVHLLSKETVVKTVLPEYTELLEKNPDLIGWIKIEDTNIDYPVVQSSDNDFYLDHNFNKESDGNGCIFLDANCSAVENSDNMILYGHHMRTGNMFGNLNKYNDYSYYKEHKYITFDTIYETGRYEIMFVFRSKVYNEDEITFKYYQFIDAASSQEFNSAMYSMAKLSLYDTGVTAEYGDKLITLSTCDYQENKGRFVVVAKRIE